MTTRAAIYARVSKGSNGQSPEMQLRELREYCERRGWQITGEYVDTGISGAKDRRPELDRMMQDAHKRRFDVIAVWKFDRFARSVSHLLRALDMFRVLGIEFVSLSESLDTATPAGRMVFTVLGAECESEGSAAWASPHVRGRCQNWLSARAGTLCTRHCRRVRLFPQPCPQNPCELRAFPRCKRSRLAAGLWVSTKQVFLEHASRTLSHSDYRGACFR
jgi:hypothetical protein